ncbi:PREDICTED: uncharacterized protein LOC106813205 [Priapulus caudatus]|uniref:Uncharacterized protein LOC106813205 n=1 Tax=Priapulus caudatus TaxID=37621 RepID=A0ABM1EKN7_PRICU|nr:PREDICTED: uncharacterized protein LOC106813205 [Priapulus caudatus]
MNIPKVKFHPPELMSIWKSADDNSANDTVNSGNVRLYSVLAEKLGLDACSVDMQQMCLLDIYGNIVLWAQKRELSVQASTTCLNLVNNALVCIAGEDANMESSLDTFVHQVGECFQAEGMTDLSKVEQLSIRNYFISNMWQHFHLYKYLLIGQRAEEVIQLSLCLDVPVDEATVPPLLNEALHEQIYNDFVAPHVAPSVD